MHITFPYTRTNHSQTYVEGLHYNCCNTITAAIHCSSREDECVHPIDAHCRADNGSESKENSLTSEMLRTSREDILVNHVENNTHGVQFTSNNCTFHSLYLRNWTGNQSQLHIFCSPIPALLNGIGFMPLRWGHKKCSDANHTPVR